MGSDRLLIVAWGIAVGFLLVDSIWLPQSRLLFVPSNWVRLAQTGFALGVLALIPMLIRFRLRDDHTAIGRLIAEAGDRLAVLLHAAALTIALGIGGIMFSYLSTSLGLPIRDAELAAIDGAFGFDWTAFLQWTDRHSLIASVLRLAYHSTGPQIIALYLLLSMTNRVVRLHEFLASLAICSLLTAIGMTLVPAEGAFAYYQPGPLQHYSPIAGMWHHETLVALRSHATPLFEFARTQGLVTFPSFHTQLAILTTYAARDVRAIAAPVAILNAIVIIGTITEGGHHVVDIAAGGAITGIAIWLTARFQAPRSNAPVVPV